MTSFIKATDFDMWKVFINVFDFKPRKDCVNGAKSPSGGELGILTNSQNALFWIARTEINRGREEHQGTSIYTGSV